MITLSRLAFMDGGALVRAPVTAMYSVQQYHTQSDDSRCKHNVRHKRDVTKVLRNTLMGVIPGSYNHLFYHVPVLIKNTIVQIMQKVQKNKISSGLEKHFKLQQPKKNLSNKVFKCMLKKMCYLFLL